MVQNVVMIWIPDFGCVVQPNGTCLMIYRGNILFIRLSNCGTEISVFRFQFHLRVCSYFHFVSLIKLNEIFET
jgi:hypothetical protein